MWGQGGGRGVQGEYTLALKHIRYARRTGIVVYLWYSIWSFSFIVQKKRYSSSSPPVTMIINYTKCLLLKLSPVLTSFSTICEKYEAVLHDYIAHVVSFVVVLSTVFVQEREFLLISSLRMFCLLTNIA